ncbi:valine--tRNA ligase [Coraliomargarita akajimensis]|uniref:Valine--tRNA ligase n=1 Tax=Coraliomargarita akajimensis (strain DSM 45221 / IAM 15411 / JCM 23193 / KCTC 12865 / 04OKA010-24) TaxID=583355 RepID=D5EM36_CORAD|nr:valine--tRNA ligase [Coraliomargarita akajimensis]ADE55196.1 valyl-tRNA synthetase [Coraliomargarita akajimensis DSM 45221]
MSEISKAYEPKEVEERWYQNWLEAGCFKAEVDTDREPYAIMIPPPNVTGMLHMGHVLDNTLQDIFIRRARLEGKAVLWQPGTDHAGIATQTKVEKQLRAETGQTKYDLGREGFLEKVWEFREQSGGVILNQLRKLGASCDWDRTSFTLDEDYSKGVLTAFVKLYERGYIYRGQRMVNWCPATHTAISDEEVIMKPQNGFFYKMRYELVEPDGERTHLEISTTRPETLMGDTAVAVHPEDERYKHLIGKTVWRPFPKAEIPIIGDEYVDREFGTGCLKVTPAHDKNDFEIGQRHQLEIIEVIDHDGKLNALAGEEFDGMERFEARKVAANKLEQMGLLIEREPYENSVGFSERGDVPIEPRLSEQWFLKYPKVEEAKRAVEKGIIKFHPDRWKKTYLHWLNGIQDWCISRQLWWGHRIPVWYKKGFERSELDFSNPDHVHVSIDGPSDPENWEQEADVLDTWASSYLWPMGNLGWPNPTADQQKEQDFWYPTSTLVTGFDIIFFWVARMIMAGLELFGEDAKELSDEEIAKRIPFKNIFIHGLIRDEKGRKMSKSLGNSPDPLDLIEKFGADGLRFGICNIAPTGSDILFSEDRIQIGRNFCNKLWNASRFRQMSGPMADNSSLESIHARIDQSLLDDTDHWILGRLAEVTAEVEKCFTDYELAPLTHQIYGFFWSDFCDWYVEASKGKLKGSEAERDHCLAIQDLVLRQVLQLANPVIPHITEELWKGLGYGGEGSFIQDAAICQGTELLGALSVDQGAVERVANLQELITQARALKAKYNLANKRDVEVFFGAEGDAAKVIEENAALIQTLAGLGGLQALAGKSADGLPAAVTPLGPLYLDLSSSIDVEAEKARLSKELAKLEKQVAAGEGKLKNPKFVNSAPEKVVEGARKQLAETTEKRDETKRILESLG